ncbi:hypothetical protein GF324_06295 [bacterium]|nr:hypothetical protein [bacterium]
MALIKYNPPPTKPEPNPISSAVFGKESADVEELARVVEVIGPNAKVQLEKQAACNSCGAKQVCHPTMGISPIIEVANEAGASVGDIVALKVDEGVRIGASLTVFGLPVAGISIGALVGTTMENAGPDSAVVGAVAGLALGLLLVRLINQWVGKTSRLHPRAARIVLPSQTG